ncbi:hypothetical protein Cgig2_029769 [Carnegiea gigantea]|uniref:Uncharacterized protein n=1 Tax=Carnegiea gigantea TaxID=171969 RepID=A0A9Q1QAE3_9CARY|nr:hypothetical protein Cgig2_029769 [Carnegiea gigantea]
MGFWRSALIEGLNGVPAVTKKAGHVIVELYMFVKDEKVVHVFPLMASKIQNGRVGTDFNLTDPSFAKNSKRTPFHSRTAVPSESRFLNCLESRSSRSSAQSTIAVSVASLPKQNSLALFAQSRDLPFSHRCRLAATVGADVQKQKRQRRKKG